MLILIVKKDTYDVLNDSIVKPLNEEMKLLMEKDMFEYFMWNEDKNLSSNIRKKKILPNLSTKNIIKLKHVF